MRKRSKVALALLAVGTLAFGLTLRHGGEEQLGEFLKEHKQFNQRSMPIAFIREKLGEEGEAKREAFNGPAQEQYENRAWPSGYVDQAQAEGAARAARALGLRTQGLSRNGTWQEMGPREGFVPGPVTYTGVPTYTSGRVTALAVSPTCGTAVCRVWVGAAGGGVWMTSNGLAPTPQWQSTSFGLASMAIGSLLVDPTDASGATIYAGTGEANGSSDSEAGMGLFRSRDNGRTWVLVPGSIAAAKDRSVATVAVDPADGRHIFIGTAVARHGASSVNGGRMTPPGAPALGLYESTNGGATFRLVFSKPSDSVDPHLPNGGDFFRGGVTRAEFDPATHQLYFSLFGYGLYRRTAAGQVEQVFASAGAGAQENSIGARTEFALAPMGDARLRIYVGDTDGGPADLYRVDDANVPATTLTDGSANPGWLKLSDSSPGTAGYGSYNYCGEQCSYDMPVASPPGKPDHVWIGGMMQYDEIWSATPSSNGRAVQRSTDAGASFNDMTMDARGLGMHPDQHAIAFVPGNPNIAFIGSDGGVVRTGGEFTDASALCDAYGATGAALVDCRSWLREVPTRIYSLNQGLGTLQFQSVSLNSQDPRRGIMGGTQDNGTWVLGATGRWTESVGGDGGQSGFDAANPNILVHSYYGPYHDVNFRGDDPLGWNWISDPLAASNEQASFYVPIITDPVVGGTMFAGLEHIWRTTDNGGPQAYLEQHCNELTGDFTVECGDWQPLGGPTLTGNGYGSDKGGSFVAAVTRAPGDSATLWTATRRGRLFISQNANAADPAAVAFTRIDTPSQPDRFMSGIAVDPRDANHAFVSFSGYNAYTPGRAGHVFEVRYNPAAGTATWADMSRDLGDQPVTAIAYDDVKGALYAATDFGVAMLPSGGRSWVPAAAGLPTVAVYGLTLSTDGRLLYAATHGRGIWRVSLGN
jgi:hypothetical protein